MEAVIAVFALLFLLFVSLGVYATAKAVGAAKRGVDRTIEQARRTVEDHTLRAKSLTQSGPAREIAHLRLTLRTSMRATQDALYAGAAEDESLKESLGLFQRLSAHGRELDADLKRLETEPDRAALAARLPELRSRTARVSESADSLRWAVRDRARHFADEDLGSLSAQIDLEADALRHWARTEPAQTTARRPDTVSGGQGTSDEGSPSGPADRRFRPRTADSRPSPDPAPPSITPPSPRLAHPWRRKPRPESTV
ncbi:hypothetical protein LK07_10665 [Streptomyces pluripotens]|uniref:Secreted protein n=1 Tax=Streptomyces pluripotens TaxID=1355015 RepID=A0A221NXA6_9ACTN|nr:MULTISPECIES: hypothetical protein [Streptomyces]ARP70169.1 hypothetical protein LK06_009550 [Streptomyces pluripotens]ASN24428.1 hypothetical protein LK07_10665 [Streptomyces pluripotens]KIE25169.1 hypothetical protein LK08_20500 [Streptomyces sp. MUSC 125]MCH0559166.1 hypothetical protein [Streptomyces sp. MUM 16J]